MMLVVLLVGSVLAQDPGEPPDKPVTPAPVPNQCLSAVGVMAGDKLPASLTACSFTAMPVSELADLLALESWGQATSDHYRISRAYWQYQLADLSHERDFYKARYEEAIAEPGWWQKPATQRTIGAVGTIATVLVTGYAMGQLAD